MTTKAAILVRVSGPGQHAENQLPGLEEWAVSLGLEVVTVYEVRQSAWKGAHRKALTEVYKDARAGRFQILLCWALDRLSREGVAATLEIINRLAQYKVRVWSLQEAGPRWKVRSRSSCCPSSRGLPGWSRRGGPSAPKRAWSGPRQLVSASAGHRGAKMGRSVNNRGTSGAGLMSVKTESPRPVNIGPISSSKAISDSGLETTPLQAGVGIPPSLCISCTWRCGLLRRQGEVYRDGSIGYHASVLRLSSVTVLRGRYSEVAV